MQLHPPFAISSRLMPALHIGDVWLSLSLGAFNHEGRNVFEVWIDFPDEEFHITDLRSGVGGASIQKGFASLLCFLTAAGESYDYRMRTGRPGENETLFEPRIVAWASENSDELSMLEMEIEENPELITD